MSLSYETHTSTGTPLLKADENLIETLEDNQVCLCCSTFFPPRWTNRDFFFNLLPDILPVSDLLLLRCSCRTSWWVNMWSTSRRRWVVGRGSWWWLTLSSPPGCQSRELGPTSTPSLPTATTFAASWPVRPSASREYILTSRLHMHTGEKQLDIQPYFLITWHLHLCQCLLLHTDLDDWGGAEQ